MRREFVSIAQAIVDPLSRNREIARLLKHAGAERQEDPTAGGLLPDPKAVPPGHERLLALASKRFENHVEARLTLRLPTRYEVDAQRDADDTLDRP